jgi:hypothetical protein
MVSYGKVVGGDSANATINTTRKGEFAVNLCLKRTPNLTADAVASWEEIIREQRGPLTRLVVAAGLAIAVLGCGGGGSPPVTTTAAPATTTTALVTTTASPTTTATAVAKLTRAEACAMFRTNSADFRATDDQSAVAMTQLAADTADPALAAAIQRVADAFRRHAPEISSSEVQALCR